MLVLEKNSKITELQNMYKFRVLVQNRRAKNGVYHFRNGYIKATNSREAIQNLNTVFSGFNFEIDYFYMWLHNQYKINNLIL